jgi:hypothetical protein
MKPPRWSAAITFAIVLVLTPLDPKMGKADRPEDNEAVDPAEWSGPPHSGLTTGLPDRAGRF